LKKIPWLFQKTIKIPEEWDDPIPLNKYCTFTDGDWILEKHYSKNGVRLLQIADIGLGNFRDKSKKFISVQTSNDLNCKIIEQGKDILISRMPDPVGKACIAPILPYSYIVSVDIAILKINESEIDRKFLVHYLNSSNFLNYVIKYVAGSTRERISRKNLENIKIFLPPLKEQKKIGSILTNMDQLIQAQQQIIEQTQKLMKGQMEKLLTSGLKKNNDLESIAPYGKQFQIFSVPRTWKVKNLGDLCQIITDGSHFSPGKNGEYPLATVENMNMNNNKIDVDSCYKIDKNDYEYLVKNNCQPKNNDVLFSKDGTIGLCLVYTQSDKIVVLSSIAIIRTKPDELDPNFLKYILKSRYMQIYLAKFKSGTALKRLILKNISEFVFPLPPKIEEQQKIAVILSNLDELIQHEKQYKEKLENLKRGLMQQLLTGEKRVIV
jgi:type I restriction enzyme, S subunit